MTHWSLCESVSGWIELSIGRYANTFIGYQGGCGGRPLCSSSGFEALEHSALFGEPVTQSDRPLAAVLAAGAP